MSFSLIGLSVALRVTPHRVFAQDGPADNPAFGGARWEGWASGFSSGLIERLCVIGGFEPVSLSQCPSDLDVERFEGERGGVSRGYGCCYALHKYHGVSLDRLDWRISEGNTGGNVKVLKEAIAHATKASPVFLSTSFYHIPRAQFDCAQEGITTPFIPAESFCVVEWEHAGQSRGKTIETLEKTFGGGFLARRAACEICGVADKLTKSYVPLSA